MWAKNEGNEKKQNPLNYSIGGAGGDRTRDLLTASQALSQLSYSPTEVMRIGYEQSPDLLLFDLIDRS